MRGAEIQEERSVADEADYSKCGKENAKSYADAITEFDEQADEVKSEKKDEGTGDGREERAILAKKRADRAGGSSKGNKDDRESANESEGGSEETGARHFAFAELLHADAGEHGNVAGHERQNAGGKERDESGKEGAGKRDISVHTNNFP